MRDLSNAPTAAAEGSANSVSDTPRESTAGAGSGYARPGPAAVVRGAPVWAVGSGLRYEPLPGSKVRIEGTSSLHPWVVSGTIIGGNLEVEPGYSYSNTFKATARIPVRTLKSYQRKMDEVMQDTLEMSRFPNIDYELIKLQFDAPATVSRSGATIGWAYDATGVLTIHGIPVTNAMPVIVEAVEGTAKLKVTGSTPLKLTDFGIKPVEVNLGIGHITTGDEVTVTFEWLVGRKP